MKVDKRRHIAKSISYRALSTGIGFFAVWMTTGSVKIGAAFSAAELLWKPLQYYIHERIWYKWITYGLKNEK